MTADLPGTSRWRIAALAFAMLLPSLGTSIANVALPTLSAAFGASGRDVQWVVIAYLLAVTTLIVTAGRLGDLVGRRTLLLAGIALFTTSSTAGMLAPNLIVLILARTFQGAGAAAIMALTMAAVGDIVPKERTGSAMGLLGTVSAVGTALGPSLGGALLSGLGWRSLFAAMATVGVAALLLGLRLFPANGAERRNAGLDAWGMVVLALALGAFALATTLDLGLWGTIGLGVAATLGLAAFIAIETHVEAPLVDLKLLDGTLSAGLVALGLVSAILMSTLVVGPFYLSHVLGLSPLQTGLAMSVGPGVAALAGIPAGRLVDRIGASNANYAGLAGVTLGAVLMTMLPAMFGALGYVASLGVLTAGYALFQAASTTAVMAGSNREQRGVVAALLALARNLGLISGASAMAAVFLFASIGATANPHQGMQVTFAVAAGLAVLAITVSFIGDRGRAPRLPPREGVAGDEPDLIPEEITLGTGDVAMSACRFLG